MSNAVLQYQQQPFEPKTLVSLGVHAINVLGKASQLTSAERKDKLKPALNEDIKSFCSNDYTTSNYLFGENIGELKVCQGRL